MQPVEDVEHDEGARRCERSLPGGVRKEEAADLRLLAKDLPASFEVRTDSFEHAAVAAVLAHEEDRHGARRRRHERGQHERRGVPDLEQEAATHERRAQRDPTQDMLNPLRPPIRRGRQQVRIEAAVGRLVDVVREEERENDQRRLPEVRHEGHQQQAEAQRAERGEHERSATTHRRVEGVAPRADHRREHQREDAFRAEHEADQRTRFGEAVQQRRQVGRRRRDREGQTECAEAENPEQAASDGLRTRRSIGRQLCH